MDIGNRVSIARRRANLSQEALAEMLDISPLFVSYIECGEKGMSLTTLKKVCQTLGVSADYLLFGDTAADVSRKNIDRTLDTVDERFLPVIEMEIKNTLHTIERLTNIIKNC